MHKEVAHIGDFGAIYTDMNKYIHDIMLSHYVEFMEIFLGRLNSKASFI
jgi:hypothetical protein